MNIEYKLLDNYTGLILTRLPEVTKELVVTFAGAPEGSTAIFAQEDGQTFYRDIENGSCRISTGNLGGEVTVTVVLLDGSTHPLKWICDKLKVVRQKDGSVLVAPNDMILSEEVVRLRLENQELRENISKLTERANEFDEWRIRLMEGYDIT